jgi:hypothetical protein
MKILRSVTQRGSSIDSAGYFSVVRPSKWFAASRLPRGFPFFADRWKVVAQPTAHGHRSSDHFEGHVATQKFQLMRVIEEDRHFIRAALIVLIAVAASAVLLWCDMNCPRLW